MPSDKAQVRTYEDVNHALTGIAESVVNHLARGKFKRRGAELVAGDIHGAPGESFSLNTSNGLWADFADSSGDLSGDMIDYWAAVRGVGKGAAKREAEEWLFGREDPVRPQKDNYVPWKDGHMAGKWTYTTADGAPWVTVYRFNNPSEPGKKDFVPWDDERKRWTMPDGMRPLFNLPAVIQAVREGRQVVVVEGEKKAERLNAMGYVATASTNGARSAHKTDWTPLAGADVLIWPDHDAPGDRYAQVVAERLKDAKAATVRRVTPPADKPKGWDAADATDEEVCGLLNMSALPAIAPSIPDRGTTIHQSPRRIDLSAWGTERWQGEPPPVDWLVQGAIPAGVPVMVAAMGDTGKSFLLLDLCARVAFGGDHISHDTIFGGQVARHGVAVMVTAEDGATTIHRRLNVVDPTGKRFAHPGRLRVVPLPDAGGPMPFVREDRDGPSVTDEWETFRRDLLEIKDLALVVIDPLQAFAHCDLNADPASAQFIASMLSRLAAETGATVIVAHHMRKSGAKPIEGPADAREAVRGSSALVDGVRLVYALWPVEQKKAKNICMKLDIPLQPNRVVRGAVVKANDGANREVQVYVRSLDGLLVDKTQALNFSTPAGKDLRRLLMEAIADAAKVGQPFSKTGNSGLYELKARLPAEFHDLPRHRLWGIADELLKQGLVVQAAASGSKAAKWLDVPDGLFARGEGVFTIGATGRRSGTPDVASAAF